MTIKTRLAKKLLGVAKDERPEMDKQRRYMDKNERIEILLWGDEELGIIGLQGQIEALRRVVIINFVLTLLMVVSMISTSVTPEGSAGIISKLFLSLVSLFSTGI